MELSSPKIKKCLISKKFFPLKNMELLMGDPSTKQLSFAFEKTIF